MAVMAYVDKDRERMLDALKAAQLYYLQDLTMEAIGEELHVSRSSVSRLLATARQLGIVDITINSPDDQPRRIETEILKKFGVKAYLVPVPDRTSHIDRLERVALSAARMLGDFFSSTWSWGSPGGPQHLR